ncbi:MAG: beta-lactamase family protein [Lysobacter sp.]|nr:beta-lactamase family protein [Lysobacter sp.]
MKLSRRMFLSGSAMLAAGLAIRPALAQAADVDAGVSSAIDTTARSAIKAGACPGIAVQIAFRGRTLLSKNHGLANIETDSLLTDNSIFRIGSLTKQFTSALVVKLASEGRLALDDAVSKHLPFFVTHKPFSLRELLNHTAGLHSDEQSTSCIGAPAGPKSQIELAREISTQATLFDFEPGTAWLYSNANYIVLGAVVEKVAAMSLAAAAATMIFKPLGLTRTAFDRSEDVVSGRVDGYSPVEGNIGTFTRAPFLEISETGGAGAMRSTVADLCLWHHALFANRIFDARFVEMMVTPGRLRDGRLSGSNRFSSDDASYGDVQYGMGLLVSPPSQKYRSVLHYGFINGFAACMESFIDVGLTTAILCNGDIGPNTPFRVLRRIVSEQLLPGLARKI